MRVQVHFATALAVVALVAALCGVGGAYAGTQLIDSGDIKNNSLLTQDLHSGAVRTSDLQNDTVLSKDIDNGDINGVDIGANEVEATDLELPVPDETVEPMQPTTGTVGEAFSLVYTAPDSYEKVDATSDLEITWNGSAAGGIVPCQFQIRANGISPGDGAGVVYVANGEVEGNVSKTATFSGLAPGVYTPQVWARSVTGSGVECTVSPAQVGIPPSFNKAEVVH